MKKFEVTFAPMATASPGELGRADYFGFVVEARNMAAAVRKAEARFDAAFGAEFAMHYTVKNIEEVQS